MPDLNFLLHQDTARDQLLFSIVSIPSRNPPSLSLLWLLYRAHLPRNLAPERNICHDATVPQQFDSGSQAATNTIASHMRRK
ncbi:hypothetical protein M419DRAFT_10162 [Trichoderma reesei RUT C-30]|uniref:Uncharacterized protein n=1 Tax=Hypocrea jecorina (strain ATCC 56765 / BCRC 32924 / NRRL 11460 / Rut C-30) TaxID=1344414 RepID=A0A024S3Z7_HYPJR|nr:hypothetical protein M419DRAFT_10162 [Trichoderma reesei RUT C-30]